jgi:chromosome segregation ATPase
MRQKKRIKGYKKIINGKTYMVKSYERNQKVKNPVYTQQIDYPQSNQSKDDWVVPILSSAAGAGLFIVGLKNKDKIKSWLQQTSLARRFGVKNTRKRAIKELENELQEKMASQKGKYEEAIKSAKQVQSQSEKAVQDIKQSAEKTVKEVQDAAKAQEKFYADNLKAQTAAYEEAIKKQTDQIKKLQEQLDELNNLASKSAKDQEIIGALQEKVKQSQRNLSNLKKGVQKYKEEADNAQKTLKKEKEGLIGEKDSLSTSLVEKEQAIATQNNQIKDLQTQLDTLRATANKNDANAQKTIKNLQQKIDEASKNVKKLENSLSKSRKESEKLTNQTNTLQEQNKLIQQEKQGLEKTISEQTDQLQKQGETIDQARRVISVSRGQTQATRKKVKGLEQAVNEKNNQLEAQREKLTQAKEIIGVQRTWVQELRGKVSNLNEEFKLSQQKIGGLQETVRRKGKRVKGLKQNLEETTKNLNVAEQNWRTQAGATVRLRKRLREEIGNVEEAQKEIISVAKAYDELEGVVQSQLERIDAQAKQIVKVNNTLNEQIQKTRFWENKSKGQNKAIKQLGRKQKSNSQTIESLQGEIKINTQKLTQQRAEIEQLQNQLKNNTQSNTELEKRVSEYLGTIDKQNKEIIGVQNSLEQLGKRATEQESLIAQNDETIAQLRQALLKFQRKSSGQNEAIKLLNRDKKVLKGELKEKDETISGLYTNLNDQNNAYNILLEKNKNLQKWQIDSAIPSSNKSALESYDQIVEKYRRNLQLADEAWDKQIAEVKAQLLKEVEADPKYLAYRQELGKKLNSKIDQQKIEEEVRSKILDDYKEAEGYIDYLIGERYKQLPMSWQIAKKKVFIPIEKRPEAVIPEKVKISPEIEEKIRTMGLPGSRTLVPYKRLSRVTNKKLRTENGELFEPLPRQAYLNDTPNSGEIFNNLYRKGKVPGKYADMLIEGTTPKLKSINQFDWLSPLPENTKSLINETGQVLDAVHPIYVPSALRDVPLVIRYGKYAKNKKNITLRGDVLDVGTGDFIFGENYFSGATVDTLRMRELNLQAAMQIKKDTPEDEILNAYITELAKRANFYLGTKNNDDILLATTDKNHWAFKIVREFHFHAGSEHLVKVNNYMLNDIKNKGQYLEGITPEPNYSLTGSDIFTQIMKDYYLREALANPYLSPELRVQLKQVQAKPRLVPIQEEDLPWYDSLIQKVHEYISAENLRGFKENSRDLVKFLEKKENIIRF